MTKTEFVADARNAAIEKPSPERRSPMGAARQNSLVRRKVNYRGSHRRILLVKVRAALTAQFILGG
jgi:hypothetical protein